MEHPTRYYSDMQEESVSKELGGRKQSNSGAGKFAKGDVVVPDAGLLIECKTPTSDKDSFSVKKDWFIKNKNESFSMRMPNNAVAITFGPGQENYYIINTKLMKYLVECLKGGED